MGDYDGDGWLDIFVTSEGSGAPAVGQHILWHNNGNGSFSNRAKQAHVATTSRLVPDGFGSCFGDYDLDGDLDLLVTSWKTFPTPSLGNKLFRNRGDGTFEDVTKRAGLDIAALPGFSPTFVDMNGDLYPELLLASDFGTSRYFINNANGTFRNATQESHTSHEANGMGSTVGDFNNDGLLDWFVTSVENGGNGNKLYFNKGGDVFREMALHCGVSAGGWGWGTVAADMDLDGWLDIVETNGWANSSFDGDPARLWLNNQDMTFSEVAAASGFDHDLNGLGMVRLDYDEDGDQDILITTPHIGQLRLYRNDQTTGRHWLRLRLDTAGSPGLAPDGYGTRVELRTGSDWQVRVLDVGCNYLSTSEPVLSFGLADAQLVDELVVRWNDGTVTKFTNLPVDQLMVVKSY